MSLSGAWAFSYKVYSKLVCAYNKTGQEFDRNYVKTLDQSGENDIFTVFTLQIPRDTTFLPLIVLIFQNVVIFLCIDPIYILLNL